MERFVQSIVAGGLALVAGLWIATLLEWGSAPSIGGVALAVVGVVALAVGIGQEIAV